MATDGLYIWTVYNRPDDFPDHVAVRSWVICGGGVTKVAKFACLYDSVENMREFMAQTGLVWLERDDSDDPKILGSWI